MKVLDKQPAYVKMKELEKNSHLRMADPAAA